MTRAKIESGIITRFNRMIENQGFIEIENGLKSEHFVDYMLVTGDVHYVLSIGFIRPNFLKYSNYLSVSSPQVTEEYMKVDPVFTGRWRILSFNLDTFLNPQNADGFYNTGNTTGTYITKTPESEEELERNAAELYNVYFKPVIEQIVPQTNSLAKLDHLLSGSKAIYDVNKPLKIRVYSDTLVRQVLASVLVAKVVNRPNYPELVKRYLKYAEKFEPGRIADIDFFRKYVNRE
jgi:hypothetical protein